MTRLDPSAPPIPILGEATTAAAAWADPRAATGVPPPALDPLVLIPEGRESDPPHLDPAWRRARRILAVRLDNLGDVLVTTPALRAIKRSLPGARLDLLASRVGAQAGRLNPDLDEVIVHEAPWIDPWQELPLDPARELALIDRIRAGRYDAAVVFTSFRQSALPAAYLCYLAGVPLRLAASVDGAGSLLTTRHKHQEALVHEVERALGLVAAVGITGEATGLVLAVPTAARERADAWLAASGLDREGSAANGRESEGRPAPLVVVHPGCSMPARTYHWRQFAAAIEGLVARLGARVVVTGAASERELVERVLAELSPAAGAASRGCAGDLPFPAFCALIERADLVITNNTGPMHVAAALGTPVVALFALTNPPEQWGPWRVPHRLLNHDVPCRLCYNRVCPYSHDCLRLVTPELVVAAAEDLLAEAGNISGDRSGHEAWRGSARSRPAAAALAASTARHDPAAAGAHAEINEAPSFETAR